MASLCTSVSKQFPGQCNHSPPAGSAYEATVRFCRNIQALLLQDMMRCHCYHSCGLFNVRGHLTVSRVDTASQAHERMQQPDNMCYASTICFVVVASFDKFNNAPQLNLFEKSGSDWKPKT